MHSISQCRARTVELEGPTYMWVVSRVAVKWCLLLLGEPFRLVEVVLKNNMLEGFVHCRVSIQVGFFFFVAA